MILVERELTKHRKAMIYSSAKGVDIRIMIATKSPTTKVGNAGAHLVYIKRPTSSWLSSTTATYATCYKYRVCIIGYTQVAAFTNMVSL